MIIDKYTKIILTVIAVGIIGINFYFYSGNFVKEAKAELNPIDIMIMQDNLVERIARAEVIITSRINEVQNETGKAFGMNILALMSIGNELGISKARLKEIYEELEAQIQ